MGKHTKLEKPLGGKFHRNEISFLGAPCDVIRALCIDISAALSDKLKTGYVDAEHSSEGSGIPFFTQYTDKIGYHRLDFHDPHIDFHQRAHFLYTDVVLVNGNHYKSDQQIVIINKKKEESLKRKLDRLTSVKCIILDKGEKEIYPFLKEALPHFDQLPLIDISDIEQLSNLINDLVVASLPELNGLVLAGGRSIRMGFDKSEIQYYDVPQKIHMASLINGFCKQTFISQRDEDIDLPFPVIADSFMGLGPFGGLLSAFRKDPNKAILSMPCDTPLINKETIKKLVENRDASKVATCFYNESTAFPEPLITIWEPRAYPVLLHFLSMGYSCPRKILINSDIKEVKLENQEVISNVNTPEDYELMMSRIKALS